MRFTPALRNLNKLLDLKSLKMLDHYSQFNPSPLTIKQFMEFGQTATEEESFTFLRKEIPVRLSNIMKEINLLPGNLLQMPSVLILQDWYAQSFRDLVEFESSSHTDLVNLANFCQTLKTVQTRHTNVVQTMAQGVLELKESHAVDNQTDMAIQYFLDRFYMSRISMRMLIHQHTLLFEPDADKDTPRIGMIDPHCKVKSVIMEAFQNAAFLCEEYYDCAPDIEIKVHNACAADSLSSGPSDPNPLDYVVHTEDMYQVRHRVRHYRMVKSNKVDLWSVVRKFAGGLARRGNDESSIKIKTGDPGGGGRQIKGQTLVKNAKGKKVGLELVYPPPHLYHILFELFKNSMRATVETHSKSQEIPEIEVLIAKGEHDVSIRVSDQGGGIPRHITDHLFHYLFSTAPRPSMTPTKAPLAGYGYGLPLSRLYARYFHGDLILNSYDGYGTDAVVYLKTLTHEATELLPVFNKTSTKQYKSAIPTADWTDPTFSGVSRGFTPPTSPGSNSSTRKVITTAA